MVKLGAGIVEHPAARGIIIDLYAEVFEFLCNAMDWYDKPALVRLRKSLGSGFHDRVKETLEEVKIIVRRLLDVVNMEAAAITKETHKTTNETQKIAMKLVAQVSTIQKTLRQHDEQRRNNPQRFSAGLKIEQSRIADVQRSNRHQNVGLRLQATAEIMDPTKWAGNQVVETLRATEDIVRYNSENFGFKPSVWAEHQVLIQDRSHSFATNS